MPWANFGEVYPEKNPLKKQERSFVFGQLNIDHGVTLQGP